MKFAIQINASPYRGQAVGTAYQFVEAALALGHEVNRIFFYYDGIYNAMPEARAPDDEFSPVERWSGLARKWGIDLVVCISAAQRRGLVADVPDEQEGKTGNGPAEGFRISGLGQLAEASIQCDRFIVFGG